jgi:hypothetical protein
MRLTEHYIRHEYPVTSVHIEEFSFQFHFWNSLPVLGKGMSLVGEENGLNVALADALSYSFSFARSRSPFFRSSFCHHVLSPVLACQGSTTAVAFRG